MPNVEINYIAVIVAAVINMIVGSVWYSPALFGKDWAKLIGRKIEDMGKDAGLSYAITALGALVQAWILANIIDWVWATTLAEGIVVGFIIWLGFVAITEGVNTIFAGTRKKLWAINTGYFLVVLVINGALLAVWQ